MDRNCSQETPNDTQENFAYLTMGFINNMIYLYHIIIRNKINKRTIIEMKAMMWKTKVLVVVAGYSQIRRESHALIL